MMSETGREAVGPEGEDRRRSDAAAHVLLSPREETRVRHGLPWYVMDYITYFPHQRQQVPVLPAGAPSQGLP